MHRPSGGRVSAAITVSLVLSAGGFAAVPATATVSTTVAVDVIEATPSPARVEIPRPARGAAAVRLLGDQLADAAAINGVESVELVEMLQSDPSVWVDPTGAVFYQDLGAAAPATEHPEASAPLGDTLQLHSKPGSSRTIFLDFDGGTASATAWHSTYPGVPTTQPAWDPSSNGPAFDTAELTQIQAVWASVSEDYAPFDVDVTTADPGGAAITRSSPADTTYGSRVLITPSAAAQSAICAGGCGGVAYINVFDKVLPAGGDGYGSRQPAWVFPQSLGNSAKNIAEAVAHEVGHNLGLSHDGGPSTTYATGHGAWAPIMGSSYTRAITHWSKGDYAGATNREDDVATITSVTGARLDEAGHGIVEAAAPPAGTAYIGTRSDVDTFRLGACAGLVSVTARTVTSQGNLDVRLTLVDALGQTVATASPPSAQTSRTQASGMGASLERTLASGTYYASIDGVGEGSWSTGYDDYGSLGAYTVEVSGCDGVATATTTSLDAAVTGRTVTLTATPTAGTASLAGSVEFRDGAVLVGAVPLEGGSARVRLDAVTPGRHGYTATFVPSGTSHASSTSAVRSIAVLASSATVLSVGVAAQEVRLAVQVSTDGGPPAGTVELHEGSSLLGAVPVAEGSASLVLSGVAPGDHVYTATFVPTDQGAYAGSSSSAERVVVSSAPASAPAPSTSAPSTSSPVASSPVASQVASQGRVTSTTTLVAPRRPTVGSRPVISISVLRGSAPARGRVRVVVGTTRTTLTLVAGKARLTLPRLRTGRLRVVVRFLGDGSTSASTAKKVLRVRR